MTPIPVVQVLCASPWYFRDASHPMDEEAMAEDWHVRTALAVERACPGRFSLECWRPDWRELREKRVTVRGMPCRVFPSRRAPLGKFSYELSLPMLYALWRKASRERFVLHLHEVHSAMGMLAAFLPGGAVKLGHTHGTPPVALRLRDGRPWTRRLHLLAQLPLERASLRRYRRVFSISDQGVEYLRGLGATASKLTMGADFEAFRPRDKTSARTRLGLPADARIIVYLGRYFRLKGVDALLEAMPAVRDAEPGAYLLMAGGLPQDELWREAKAGADKALPRVPASHAPDLLAASELCVVNAGKPDLLGIGIAATECWAMGVPVLTSALEEFPGHADERDQLGVLHRPDGDDLARSILRGLSLESGPRLREIAQPHYDWAVIARVLADAYKEAFAGSS